MLTEICYRILLIIYKQCSSAATATATGAATITTTNNPRITTSFHTCFYWKYSCCSFFLDRNIFFYFRTQNQSAARTTTESSSSSTLPLSTMHKYFELLILALVIPAIGLNTYGILVLASHLYQSDSPYLSLLFVLFIPAGAILFLVSKLRIAYKTNA